MVTLAFDDGLATVFNNAIPILNAHNIKSSQYIITHNFNEQRSYVKQLHYYRQKQ
jgi:peptidoglycan/xylan/chitin deacetylase (PgdA/CDA1 family)